MRRMLLILITLFTGLAHASEPEPILVIQETNPWGMVIGADSAAFAIYDDGTVIYRRITPTEEESFLQRRVTDPSSEAGKLLGYTPEKMEAEYEISSVTDQVSTTIWTPRKSIWIYGNWREPFLSSDNDPHSKSLAARERKMGETLPTGIRSFLSKIEKEREKEGEPWLPANIEVMLWPYEYAPGDSINWPATWPDLKSNTTRKRDEDSYSVYLPAKLLPDLKTFLSTKNERGAILINGKKMTLAYRFPFPNEEKWMR